MPSCCTPAKPARFVLNPDDLPDGCCSEVVAVENADGSTTYTHSDGNGGPAVEWTTPPPCSVIGCATAPDGSLVVTSLAADGSVTYSTASGSPWTGDAGDLV